MVVVVAVVAVLVLVLAAATILRPANALSVLGTIFVARRLVVIALASIDEEEDDDDDNIAFFPSDFLGLRFGSCL